MKIYEFRANGKGHSFDTKPNSRILEIFGKEPFKGNWPKIDLKKVTSRTCNTFPNVIYLFPEFPIFREKVVNALCEFFNNNCEAVPFIYKKETFFIINPINIKNCVISENNYHFKKQHYDLYGCQYSIDKDRVAFYDLFYDSSCFSSLLVSEKFKTAYEKTGFEDALFIEVYDSDEKINNDEKYIEEKLFSDLKTILVKPEGKNETALDKQTTECNNEDELVNQTIALVIKEFLDLILNNKDARDITLTYFYDGVAVGLGGYITNNDDDMVEIYLNEMEPVVNNLEKLFNMIQQNSKNKIKDEIQEKCYNVLINICNKINSDLKNAIKEHPNKSVNRVKVLAPEEID